MMRRRPVAVRRGPGLMGAVARTAVVAGTATVTAKAVGGAMDSSAQRNQQAAAANEAANEASMQSQADMEQMKTQMSALQAQQAQAAAAPAPTATSANDDLLAKIQQLAQLKDAGVLTDEEFSAAKAKLLNG